MGVHHSVTFGQALDFVEEFGINSFLDIVDQAIDGVLDAGWFNKVIQDFKIAREAFPYLGRYETQ
jgi:hypothetical protein